MMDEQRYWWDSWLAMWSVIGDLCLEHWATGRLPTKVVEWQWARRPDSGVAK